jgi:hypothetical protein
MENDGKCGDGSCECDCDEVTLRTKLKQIVLARKEAQESAETRRRMFVKQHWSLRWLWQLSMFLPLFVVISLEKVEPQLSRIYHDQLVYAAIALTCLFIFLAHWKRLRVDREFAKLHPEDAEILAWCDDDEDE